MASVLGAQEFRITSQVEFPGVPHVKQQGDLKTEVLSLHGYLLPQIPAPFREHLSYMTTDSLQQVGTLEGFNCTIACNTMYPCYH